MALQVYHTYTSVDLRYFVQWHSDVWVPQQMRVIEDELLSDDVLGNFLHDVWELKRKDPIASPNSVLWAHLYRTKFFEGDRVIIDDPLLVGNKFHAFPLRPLLEFVNAKGNKLLALPRVQAARRDPGELQDA
jgi:hypothetical protein